eukprot:3395754-Amphidinium_carterae.1
MGKISKNSKLVFAYFYTRCCCMRMARDSKRCFSQQVMRTTKRLRTCNLSQGRRSPECVPIGLQQHVEDTREFLNMHRLATGPTVTIAAQLSSMMTGSHSCPHLQAEAEAMLRTTHPQPATKLE